MRDRPDVLTALLRHLRITTSHLARIELGAPWGVRADPLGAVTLHHVLTGGYWLTHEGREIAVEAGDLVVLAHGSAYEMRHARGATVAAWPRQTALSVRHRLGGPGALTVMLRAELTVTGAARTRLARALPPVVLLPAGEVPSLDGLLGLLRQEVRADRPGAALVADRLTELLLVQGVRAELERPAAPGSWRAALADDRIARALDAIYTEPRRPWTLAGLAHAAGLSRTTFAARFRELVGETPIAHLTAWRIALAADLLREQPGLVLAEVAARVGYADEFAFGAAFRRATGVPPGAYRLTASSAGDNGASVARTSSGSDPDGITRPDIVSGDRSHR